MSQNGILDHKLNHSLKIKVVHKNPKCPHSVRKFLDTLGTSIPEFRVVILVLVFQVFDVSFGPWLYYEPICSPDVS